MKQLGVTPMQGTDRIEPILYKIRGLAITYLNNRLNRRRDTRTDIISENRTELVSVKCASEGKSARNCLDIPP